MSATERPDMAEAAPGSPPAQGQPSPEPEPGDEGGFFPHRGWRGIAFLAFLLLAALAIRLRHAAEPTFHWNPTRQYRGASIARGYYLEGLRGVPDWQRRVASVNKRAEGILEPPVLEFLSAVGYRLVGGERFWIPRALSSLFWVLGGVFLYKLARKLAAADGAVVALAFYLFLPFGIMTSRVFMPDPLMVMAALASLYAIAEYWSRPSGLRLAVAGLVAAAAVLIKAPCVFPIFGAFGALAIQRHGLRRALLARGVLGFAAISLPPAVLYYGLALLHDPSLAPQSRFLPHLLLGRSFWLGWLYMIEKTVGHVAFIAALLGLLLIRSGRWRAMMAGFWLGYVVHALVFTYHNYTHTYYHLFLVPLVALCVAPVAARVTGGLSRVCQRWRARAAAWAVMLLALALSACRYVADDWRLPDHADFVRTARQVGQTVQHSIRTVILSPHDSVVLRYAGELSGLRWPDSDSLRVRGLDRTADLTAEERFKTLYSRISPEYFIVTYLEDYAKQPDLRSFLERTYPVLARTEDFVIFDLRKPNAPAHGPP